MLQLDDIGEVVCLQKQTHCIDGDYFLSGKTKGEDDIHECGEIPCQHDGLCFERSNRSLYEVGAQLPAEVMPIFDRVFAYGEAAGYVCSCQPGYEGKLLSVIIMSQ